MGRPHGRARYVVDHCRCAVCQAANSAYENRRNRLKAYGQWTPYVNAAPARAHVQQLSAAGLGWRRVAEISGVPPGVISKLLYGSKTRGPSKRIRPETEVALLAVGPVPVAEH